MRLVLEHSEIGDVQLLTIGRQRQCKRQTPHLDVGDRLARFDVDGGHPEIGLIDGVEDAAVGVQGQVARKAVVVTGLVEVDGAAAFGVPVQQGDAPGIALGDVGGPLAGEGQAHEDAPPIAGIGFQRSFWRTHEELLRLEAAGLFPLQNRERVYARTCVRRNNRFSRGTDDQAEGSRTGSVLVPERQDDAAARQN